MTTYAGDTDSQQEIEQLETRDWLNALDDVIYTRGRDRVKDLLHALQIHAQRAGIELPVTSQTPYINTIPAEMEPPYPGSRELERRIKSIIRWNAMAMVVRANKKSDGIGGHISTYASSATLLEVGFNHFFRGPDHECGGDIIYFQGHGSPGPYARAFVEGRLNEEQLVNFRRELQPGGGLSSYPHPWLMPDFWQYPTVSMGLGPLMSIYQARYMRYLHSRGLADTRGRKVWAFVGDGETDEPETLGAINLATRERLDNLIWVVNCNLQRLDGPVRGNGKIIQELEAVFRGAGWNVIKVIWGSDWDPLLAKDRDGRLVRRMGDAVDGDYQKYGVEGGAYIRKHFFGADPRLEEMVRHLSDEDLWHLRRGGHDPVKVYAAYKAAVDETHAPTVILAKTIKGYGLGEAGEGKNITHSQKKLNEEELLHFCDRFDIPIPKDKIADIPFYRPADDSPEMQYLLDRRRQLGGSLPQRRVTQVSMKTPSDKLFGEFAEGTGDREVSTTMAFVRLLSKLVRDKEIGKHVVPIVPDEARTFGMEAMFRQCGIYASTGQLYEPVDVESLLFYKEAKDGQILEEGITEAGSMCSFIAAGTSHASHGVNTIPFYIYYSMFGFQRVGDLWWAAADSRTRGFLIGGTAGRTTLNGEGLQHQDGHSHVLTIPVPNLLSYDPAFAYEIAVIVQEGIRRMYENGEDVFYYLTVGNENYIQPAQPKNCRDGILSGLYRFRSAEGDGQHKVQLFGSGSIMNHVLKAQEMLAEHGVAADVWSATSYKQLYVDAIDTQRWNRLHPNEKPRESYLARTLGADPGTVVAASDYLKVLPNMLAPYIDAPVVALGTDGFGRSESREALRDFFEVDERYVTVATLHELARQGKVKEKVVSDTIRKLDVDPEKLNPRVS